MSFYKIKHKHITNLYINQIFLTRKDARTHITETCDLKKDYWKIVEIKGTMKKKKGN